MVRNPHPERPSSDEHAEADTPQPIKAATAESLAARIVKDPANVPGLYLLSGLLGDAVQPDRKRLYVTPDFSRWLDIPADAVLHAEPVQTPGAWPGTTIVWVRQDAQITPGDRFTSSGGR
jgi:hypothetical protein